MGMSSSWWRGAKAELDCARRRDRAHAAAAADGAGGRPRAPRCRLPHRRGAVVARARAGNRGQQCRIRTGRAGRRARSRRATRHDRSQRARAHRAVARLRRKPRPPPRRHSQRRLGRRVPARPRHGGLLRQQGLCAVVQRGAARANSSRRGVRVTALCPGPVPTEFQARAGLRRGGTATGCSALSGASAWRRSATVVSCAASASSSPGSATRSRSCFVRLTPNALLLPIMDRPHAAARGSS